MAATVLNSTQAIGMSVHVVRAFVRLREALAANKELTAKLAQLEERVETHDGAIQEIDSILKRLLSPPPRQRRKIGFRAPHDEDGVVAIRTARAYSRG